jgi:anti-sigma regulatory factor (Ser/Thr protein kinase)/CheY-like chemotaxis protein
MDSRNAILVSDDPQVKAMLGQILARERWIVYNAADNAAALQLSDVGRVDLVVTGAKTSGREDVELLRQIRRHHPHIRFVILTSETTPADVVSAMREHAFGYFSMSSSLPVLTSIVQHAIAEPCWDDGIEIVSATPDWVVLKARCEMKTAERLERFFYEMIDLPEADKDVLAIAFREMLMNAIEHGGKFDPDKYVEISYVRTRRAVACRIKDPGEGFDLKNIPHAAVMNPPEDPLRHLTYREAQNLRAGGFGVLLVKHSIDELLYNEKGNEVVLVKYIDRESHAAS